MMETKSADLSWLDRYVYCLLSRSNGNTMLLEQTSTGAIITLIRELPQNSLTDLHSDGLWRKRSRLYRHKVTAGRTSGYGSVSNLHRKIKAVRKYLMNDQIQCHHY